MILLEVTVIATGGEVQGRIGAPQPLRGSHNADRSGPSSNQMATTNTETPMEVNSTGTSTKPGAV